MTTISFSAGNLSLWLRLPSLTSPSLAILSIAKGGGGRKGDAQGEDVTALLCLRARRRGWEDPVRVNRQSAPSHHREECHFWKQRL